MRRFGCLPLVPVDQVSLAAPPSGGLVRLVEDKGLRTSAASVRQVKGFVRTRGLIIFLLHLRQDDNTDEENEPQVIYLLRNIMSLLQSHSGFSLVRTIMYQSYERNVSATVR